MAEMILDPNEILSSEFEYAAQTAFQAHEDRVRIFNYYLATAGTLVAAVVLTDWSDDLHLIAFGLLFAGLTVLGVASFLKLIKLRLAWVDSIRTMCQIKEFYIQTYGEHHLEKAFRWTMETIPTAGRKWSVAFMMAVTIALLSSACSGGSVLLFSRAFIKRTWFIQSALVSVFTFIVQIILWFRLCKD